MAGGAVVVVGEAAKRTGYLGFGSFFGEDVEVLVRQPPSEYRPPPLPFAEPDVRSWRRGGDAGGGSNGADDGDSRDCPLLFGGAAARAAFLVDFDRWTFVNHGAFGAVARPVFDAADAWRRHCERQPLAFIDRQLFPHMVRVIRECAAFVNAPAEDLVLLPNATAGLSAVIASAPLRRGDRVFSLDIGYGSVKKMLQAACDAAGAESVVATVPLLPGPPSADELVALVARELDAAAAAAAAAAATATATGAEEEEGGSGGGGGGRVRLAVFDAVTSNTALVLPVARLVALCRARGVPVLIDGAHALGMLPLDLASLRADYFVTNAHKWLCGARGSALMYVARERQAALRPPVLSHGARGGLLSRFIWAGNADHAPLLALSTAIRWWRALDDAGGCGKDSGGAGDTARNVAAAAAETRGGGGGGGGSGSSGAQAADSGGGGGGTGSGAAVVEACVDPSRLAHPGDGGAAARVYTFSLLRAAADRLAARWGTQCLAPPAMTAAMTLVRLPSGGAALPAPGAATSDDAQYVQDLLHHRHAIEAPVKCVAGALWVRLSAHVYNAMDDYEQLGDAVEALLTMRGDNDAGGGGGGYGVQGQQ